MMRVINRQAIFDDDEDCRRFMDILADLPFQHDDYGRLLPIRTCVIYAWCLMMNHFHLLVMEKDWKIAIDLNKRPVEGVLLHRRY